MICLASGSPRRKEILEKVGIEFDIITSDVEEVLDQSKSPEINAMALAYLKGYDVSNQVLDRLVLSADTVVYTDRIMGKPENRQDAYDMLKELSGKEHTVITGYALIHREKGIKIVDYCETKVFFRPLSEADIQLYLDTEEAFGKAGAYAIQGFGTLLVEKIDGDFFNVVGLPIGDINQYLKTILD